MGGSPPKRSRRANRPEGLTDEAVQMPTLRAVALFREYFVRTLLAPARLPAGAERAFGPRAGGRRLAGARRSRPALPLLRQRRLRRVQLARAGRRSPCLLPRLPPQSHPSRPFPGAEPPPL